MPRPPRGPPPPYQRYPHHPHGHPHHAAPGTVTYVQTPVMMPVYQPPVPEPAPSQPTYVTNYIYQQAPPVVTPPPGAKIEWISATPATASSLAHKAVVGGNEGWDGSPLWVIRAHHCGELVPGKLAIKHRTAFIAHGGLEIAVHHFEVMCSQHGKLHWLPSSNGNVPVGAINAGNTTNAEPLYIGRAKHLNSLTPGKVHPSHGCCYISFSGQEINKKSYEVLCKIVG